MNIYSIIFEIVILFIMGYPLYKSIKRKQIIWSFVLMFNFFVLGYYMPSYEAIMLPLIYLVKYKYFKDKNFKKQKIKWWGFIVIALSVVLSFFFLVPIDPSKPIDVIVTSLLIGYIVKLILNNQEQQ
jgi:4-amino-4-deoxy-L-arabinose transferase-like glycosyltransferase